jgi:hypothetical protein
MYIYIYIYISIYTDRQTDRQTHTHTHTHTHAQTTYTDTHWRTPAHIRICMHVFTGMHVHICIRKHPHIHVPTHMYIFHRHAHTHDPQNESINAHTDIHCHSHNNWGPRNGFQRFLVSAYYWNTVGKPETDPPSLWEWQYDIFQANWAYNSCSDCHKCIHTHHMHACAHLYMYTIIIPGKFRQFMQRLPQMHTYTSYAHMCALVYAYHNYSRQMKTMYATTVTHVCTHSLSDWESEFVPYLWMVSHPLVT